MKIDTADFTNFLAAGGQLTMSEWNELSDEDKTKASVVGLTMNMRQSQRVTEYLISGLNEVFGEAQVEASLDQIVAELLSREHVSAMPTS